MKNNILIKTTIVLLTTTIFLGVGLSSSYSSATSASTATASVKVASACTMSISGGGSYSATIPSGTSSEISGSTFTVTCNDANGFALYAVGNSNNTLGNTNLIGTSTNIATNTSGNDSYWAMKVNPTSGNTPTIENSFNNYHVVPNAHTKVASYSQSTGSGSLAVQATYKASISSTQLAGNYLGQVKYTLIHPNMTDDSNAPVTPLLATDCPAGYICYAPNADDIEGSMSSLGAISGAGKAKAGKTNVGTSATTADLIAPNYSRSGYGFAGWSTDYDAASTYNNNHDADITIFGPNETITLASDGTGDANISTNGLILYPVWIASAGTIQNWNTGGTNCNALTQASYNSTTGELSATLSSMTALTDERDGNVYTVARLADGNCWMAENLRLNSENTIGDVNKSLAQGYGDDTANNRGKFIGLADSENSNFRDTNPTAANNATNSIYSSDGSTEINIGTANNPAYRIPRYNNNNINRTLTASRNGTDSSIYYQWYGYGNYYNWPASIASTNYYLGPTATDPNGKTSETAGTSLCPAGWQLPYGRNTGNGATSKGFSYLDTKMGGTGASSSTNSITGLTMSRYWRKFPNNFVYSGYFPTVSDNNRGRCGRYWSSTANTNFASHYLNLRDSNASPGTYSEDKYHVNSIRCVAGS